MYFGRSGFDLVASRIRSEPLEIDRGGQAVRSKSLEVDTAAVVAGNRSGEGPSRASPLPCPELRVQNHSPSVSRCKDAGSRVAIVSSAESPGMKDRNTAVNISFNADAITSGATPGRLCTKFAVEGVDG